MDPLRLFERRFDRANCPQNEGIRKAYLLAKKKLTANAASVSSSDGFDKGCWSDFNLRNDGNDFVELSLVGFVGG